MGGLYPAVYAFVSVPYRGATFLNPGFGSSYSILAIKVSVPYRGATFLNATPQ